MTEITFPAYTDDGGDYQSGTIIDASFFDDIKSGIDAVTHSSNNPTITPADVIDEIVTARGNADDLDERISGVIDDDGALITPASVASQANLQAQVGSAINLFKNSTFFLWSRGLTSAPDYFTLANGTVTIAGTSQTDTTRKVGDYCAKLTWSSGTATLTQKILDTTAFGKLDHLKGETLKIAFGMWVKSSIASHARVVLDDGDDTTPSDYHTGGGDWEFLTGVHTVSAAATKLDVVLQNAQSGACYFSGGVVFFSDVIPARWFPEPLRVGSVTAIVSGTLTTGDGKKYFSFNRPTLIKNLQAFVLSDPTGDGLSIDFEKFEPTTTWTSMITAGDIIDDGDGVGNLQPTGDYDHRCLSGMNVASGELSATATENTLARLNIDTVGSTTPGTTLYFRVDGLQCVHPFEDQLAYNFVGE